MIADEDKDLDLLKEATQYEVQSLLAKKSVQIEYANEFVQPLVNKLDGKKS